MDQKGQVEGLKNAVGVVAEMSLIYFRALQAAGASAEECMKLTQAYISAWVYGNSQQKQEEDGGGNDNEQ